MYDHMAKRANPELLSDRAKRDMALRPEIERVWEQNDKVYGVRRSGIRCAAKASTLPDAR